MNTARREKGSSITRVLEIIEAIAQARQPISATELSLQLDIPKASAHRLVQTLEQEGFLQTGLRGGLLPGERLHRTALGLLHASRHKAERQAILRELSATIGETCGISLPDGLEMLYFDRVQTNWPLQINLPVGTHTPLWCTASGKLYLASLAPAQLERLLPRLQIKRMARNTLADLADLHEEIERVRASGVGTDGEEFIDGMVACAVPLRGPQGELIACLFIHAPVIRRSLEDLTAFVPQLREAAAALEALIGAPTEI